MISYPHEAQFPARDVRKPVNFRGYAVFPWGDVTEVVVSNLSYEGCELRTPELMRRGDTFELRVARRGLIRAQVRWTGNQRAGCRFVLPEPTKAL